MPPTISAQATTIGILQQRLDLVVEREARAPPRG